MEKIPVEIPSIWGGKFSGLILKNSTWKGQTKKVIFLHGWLDNFNAFIQLAEKLVQRNQNLQVLLYDRAGHGFSSHLAKCSSYSQASNLVDLRSIVLQLGWNREKILIIGHSFGAMIATQYAACYPDEVSHLVAIDALPRKVVPTEMLWTSIGHRIEEELENFRQISKDQNSFSSMEKILKSIVEKRPGIDEKHGRILLERSVREVSENQFEFTRDPSLKTFPPWIFPDEIIREAARSITAPVLYIGALKPQWPLPQTTIEYLKEFNENFEMTKIDGPHHLQMTHVDDVLERIERFLLDHPDPIFVRSKI